MLQCLIEVIKNEKLDLLYIRYAVIATIVDFLSSGNTSALESVQMTASGILSTPSMNSYLNATKRLFYIQKFLQYRGF